MTNRPSFCNNLVNMKPGMAVITRHHPAFIICNLLPLVIRNSQVPQEKHGWHLIEWSWNSLQQLSIFLVQCKAMTWWLREVQPLPDLCKGYVQRNFTQVEFYISQNSPKFSSVFFIPHAGKITKVRFEMYDKKIKTVLSTYFLLS